VAYSRTKELKVFLSRCRPATRAFYEYWDSKRQGRSMPARKDFNAAEMKRWHSFVQLIGVDENPRRFGQRPFGAHDKDARNGKRAVDHAEEAFAGFVSKETLKNLNMVVDRKSFVFDWSDYLSPSGMRLKQEALLLPLSEDGKSVDAIIVYHQTDEPFLSFESAAKATVPATLQL
jgi:hypothetical protein